MASKGPRSKLDHETRAKRPKALEAPKEPRRHKTHWDHVLEEMVWLSKDFESERKWKLTQAKKVALRASKGMVDQATKGEKKVKEEEQRLRKVALNISKDVKKFWLKIEKLVHYKHQMELEDKKKKALDKQLEYLLGQTERYSTMLAENLVDSSKSLQEHNTQKQLSIEYKHHLEKEIDECADVDAEHELDAASGDDDYDINSEDDVEDDEHTVDKDEALITEEERKEELAALQNEMDLPLDELLKRYALEKVDGDSSSDEENTLTEPINQDGNHSGDAEEEGASNVQNIDKSPSLVVTGRRSEVANGSFSISEDHFSEAGRHELGDLSDISKKLGYDFNEEQEDGDFVLATEDAMVNEIVDDEATLSEEEELAKGDTNDSVDEIALLQKESELPIEELLARYRKGVNAEEVSEDEAEFASASSEFSDAPADESSDLHDHHLSMNRNNEHSKLPPTAHSQSEEEEAEHNIESEERESESIIADAAAAARAAQPTGSTFSTTKVRTKFPFLLKYPLREYQHIGLDWLVTMYEKRLNGILADEMGLGKTIMTIALLAHLACEKGIWGPHLIVVPTSVMLNWETEFLKWCPAFKILTYFGSAKERKIKRQGWLKPNFFHVCITTYRLVIQDSKVFKRKKWKYLILDEAHLIKNWKSQRWQTLLNFNSKRRILLTGTPLQNDLMELWSLMHFLMPHIFQSHQEFKDWFSNPISGMVEGQEKVNKEVIDRLHNVLRPFLLRRLKRDVEKQLPMKREHVINCRLSRRQRNLYEDFIASSETQATLASANFFGMISVIMQLRKVCNHPDLFEGRPIISSFDMVGIDMQLSSMICSLQSTGPFSTVDLTDLGFLFTHHDYSMASWESDAVNAIATPSNLIEERVALHDLEIIAPESSRKRMQGMNIFEDIRRAILVERLRQAKERAVSIAWWNSLRCRKKPMYSTGLRELVTVRSSLHDVSCKKVNPLSYSSKLAEIVLLPVERFKKMIDLIESFMFAIPAARSPPPLCWCSRTEAPVFLHPTYKEKCSENLLPLLSPIRPAIVRRQVYFPDRRLIQFDCGKLQELAILLRKLKSEGHRALIFTQMTKMLDILEAFINLYGYTYMRLDGSTMPEERQTLMQRFNTTPKIFLFILSTRSGGVGINLVGADTVIFYDSDWNPAMDQQAQDRCHRIGQTREVHIYRLISESTIEENILKKANQKRALDDLVIQSGGYNTEFFKKLNPLELFSAHRTGSDKNLPKDKNENIGTEGSVSNAEVEAALKHAEDEADYMALKKVEEEEAVDNQEFTEDVIERLDDDEAMNEDDVRVDEPAETGNSNKDEEMKINKTDPSEERGFALAGKDEDADMLADVRQMAAAAAAAGQAISSFEIKLRPIDRYAIRFLELWDPIVDKAAFECEVSYDERDWELDRIEKLKEDMETEIDDEEEPLVYEQWDADFATEAYRLQVEALAQHQLLEDLELEAKEREKAEAESSMKNDVLSDRKPKTKKRKTKKTKFKSLKRRSLASELKVAKEEIQAEPMSTDDEDFSHDGVASEDVLLPRSVAEIKRKVAEVDLDTEEMVFKKKKSKKNKKNITEKSPMDVESSFRDKKTAKFKDSKSSDSVAVDAEPKTLFRSKMGGKISISTMPIKRVMVIKPEKLKRTGNIWSGDSFPAPDVWLAQEDAILCAIVHEYGPHWSLVGDILYGMTAGGHCRGRFRHPVHCCERYRELVQKHVLSTSDALSNDKISNANSGKALLKVTEDNVRMLLNFAIERPDKELLLQRHFTALLSTVWRVKSNCQKLSTSRNNHDPGKRLFGVNISQIFQTSTKKAADKFTIANSHQSGKLLAAALSESDNGQQNCAIALINQREEAPVIEETLELTLKFQVEEDDQTVSWPPEIHLSVLGPARIPFLKELSKGNQFQVCRDSAEDRFRAASRACIEGSLNWASSTFPMSDSKLQSTSKSRLIGKHKISSSDPTRPPSKSRLKRTLEPCDMLQLASESIFQPKGMLAAEDPQLHLTLSPVSPGFSFDFNPTFDINGSFSSEAESSDLLLHDYVPGITSGLDDFSNLSDYTDIDRVG